MTISERRARERADRHQLIIRTARDLAENEGWDAVTTRRLAELVEYSQPVLYSHFSGKDAIVRAVAIEGFAELAVLLRTARLAHHDAAAALRAIAQAYLDFARDRPVLYDAMFVQPVGLPFGTADAPPQLLAAFTEILPVLQAISRGRDTETLTEVFWSALHGQATLSHDGRLRPAHRQDRIDLLLDSLTGPSTNPPDQ